MWERQRGAAVDRRLVSVQNWPSTGSDVVGIDESWAALIADGELILKTMHAHSCNREHISFFLVARSLYCTSVPFSGLEDKDSVNRRLAEA